MSLGKDVKKIQLGGGYVYLKNYLETPTPFYHPVGYTAQSQIVLNPTAEDVHDETGELVVQLIGDDSLVFKTVAMQSTKEEIDLIRNLKSKRCAVMYLIPVVVYDEVRIDVFEFVEARVVPNIEPLFNTKRRDLTLELHIIQDASDLWCEDMHENVPFWGRTDLTFEETDILLGRV